MTDSTTKATKEVSKDDVIGYAKRVIACMPFAMDPSAMQAHGDTPSPFSDIDGAMRRLVSLAEAQAQQLAATDQRLVPEKFRVADRHGIDIVWRGGGKWAVSDGFGVLSKSGMGFEWEPQPSSRTDEFIADTRFDSPIEALEALNLVFPLP